MRRLKFLFPLLGILLLLASTSVGCRHQNYQQGERIYVAYCANCHMEDGSGLVDLIPPLDSARLTLSTPEKLVCLIRNGLPVNTLTGQEMPGNTSMTDVELTNLINFLGAEYGRNRQTVKVTEVKKMLADCQSG